MPIRNPLIVATILALVASACKPAETGPDLRGAGAPVAQLPPEQRAAIYDRVLREAFDITQELVLLVDPAKLPRTGGMARDERIPSPVLATLERLGAVRGRCEPAGDTTRVARCDHTTPGYVVRVSDVFDRAGDSVRVFVAVERYEPTASETAVGRFSFEDGFDLVPKGSAWRVVRRGRQASR